MNESQQITLGLAFLGLIILALCGYIVWNIWVRDGKVRRVADDDRALIENGEITEREWKEKIQSMIGYLINANATLAGITIAAVFITIALKIAGEIEIAGTRLVILYIVLGLASVSSICWLFAVEQLTQMGAPSVTRNRLLNFQSNTYNLWVIGMVLLLLAIYLFLLIMHPYVAMIAGFATFWIVIGYWNIHNEWPAKKREGVRNSR